MASRMAPRLALVGLAASPQKTDNTTDVMEGFEYSQVAEGDFNVAAARMAVQKGLKEFREHDLLHVFDSEENRKSYQALVEDDALVIGFPPVDDLMKMLHRVMPGHPLGSKDPIPFINKKLEKFDFIPGATARSCISTRPFPSMPNTSLRWPGSFCKRSW